MIELPEVGDRYGAPMGRSDTINDTSYPVVFEVEVLQWVDGAYDKGGAYWGGSNTEHIYRFRGESSDGAVEELFIRATSLKDARDQVVQKYPNASFTDSVELEAFTAAYIEVALHCSTNDRYEDDPDDNSESLYDTGYEISDDTRVHFETECRSFFENNKADILAAAQLGSYSIEHAGGDFWYTRNRDGVGFWDRELGDLGSRLTEASRKYAEEVLYVGDDNLIRSEYEYRADTSISISPGI